ncbi:MAG TPA: thymidine kinase [Spirochaetota bacterium]|nr:thymidine kinase [Spirochaetota bacterium]HPH01915.1 thymidine kinase [Spirochaetota bacterium]
MAKLYFRYSAMGAGKSLDLLKVAYNYDERGMKALIFNSELDTRFGRECVASRAGIHKNAIPYGVSSDFRKLYRETREALGAAVHCLLVDEAQFLTKTQVEDIVHIVNDEKIPVICYGLRTDFMGQLFEGSTWLLAWADAIEELKTVCWCGRKATMNARIVDGRIVRQGEQVQIGGNESYIALCREHYLSGELER